MKRLPDAPAPQLNLMGMSDLLNYQLRMAHVAMFRDFDETMGELDLTQRLWQTLHLIGANPGASQVDVAIALGTDRATMMAIVDRLERRGLTQRTRSVIDRRRQELSITKTGNALLAQANRAIREHERHFTSCFSADELKMLAQALDRIRRQVRLDRPNKRKGGHAAAGATSVSTGAGEA